MRKYVKAPAYFLAISEGNVNEKKKESVFRNVNNFQSQKGQLLTLLFAYTLFKKINREKWRSTSFILGGKKKM